MTRLRFTIFLIAFLSVFLFANKTNASCPSFMGNKIQLSVHIPGLSKDISGTGLTGNALDDGKPCYAIEGGLPQYIAGIYNFGLMVAGFLAMVMIMIGGFMYIAAGGNQTIIGKAKERIFNALIGLVILLLAYTILHTINPELVTQEGGIGALNPKKLKSIDGPAKPPKPAPTPGTTTTPATPAATPPPAGGS